MNSRTLYDLAPSYFQQYMCGIISINMTESFILGDPLLSDTGKLPFAFLCSIDLLT